MSKLIRDGKVAILYSAGYGAGWSTWNQEHAEFLRIDAGLVALVERNATVDEVEAYLKANEITDVYTGGWPLDIEWLPIGTEYYIHEYDGSETVKTKESDNWSIA